ncbi:hypothetical protein [Streptomyces sp. AK010]|uniref:hypothetical protein n=1 Tax=Streptomyces sp. AK010 TaxID=2723074 RepID=UPI0021AAD74D|nr:hypothetical protein [Streptomyces sp. AK010]
MAGMVCYQPGRRSRMFYAVREYRCRLGQPKGFGWRDLRDLVVRARIQLGGPILLVWDNVRLHLTAGMGEFIAANATWLTVFQQAVFLATGFSYRWLATPALEALTGQERCLRLSQGAPVHG